MFKSKIAGIGKYVPKNVFTNNDLMKYMDTTDEWIQERTGIKERRYGDRTGETTTTMGVAAAKIAIERAGITPQDIDFIIFATLSPDYYFPGCGVLLQRAMQMKDVGALDVRNQCSGFVYALSVADQFIKSGMYKNILVVGAEKHSFGLDFSTRGRNVTVIFGDGAGAAVLQPTEKENRARDEPRSVYCPTNASCKPKGGADKNNGDPKPKNNLGAQRKVKLKQSPFRWPVAIQ